MGQSRTEPIVTRMVLPMACRLLEARRGGAMRPIPAWGCVGRDLDDRQSRALGAGPADAM